MVSLGVKVMDGKAAIALVFGVLFGAQYAACLGKICCIARDTFVDLFLVALKYTDGMFMQTWFDRFVLGNLVSFQQH